MLALEAMNETQDIQLYINSQGARDYMPAAVVCKLWLCQKICISMATLEWQMRSRCCNAGGSPYATIAILDMMDAIKCDISTVAFGMCASTATLLLVSVTAFGHEVHCHKGDHICM